MNDLMQKRFKVIADYPDRQYSIGAILTRGEKANHLFIQHGKLYAPMHEKILERMPHLFKELQWWEKRSLDEMPEYVKNENKVFKVIEWRHGALWIECRLIGLRGAHYPIDLNLTPATLEEYNLYIKTKQQNP